MDNTVFVRGIHGSYFPPHVFDSPGNGRERAYVYTGRGAIEELCSNCAKLRISADDELRDLQYNCDLHGRHRCRRRVLLPPPLTLATKEWRRFIGVLQ